MIKVTVFTGTRAEYGLLYWLMKDLNSDADIELNLLVSGSHLSPEFGNTVNLIEEDGFNVSEKIEMLVSSDTSVGVIKSMGLGLIGFADALDRLKPNILIVLGDRFEAFSAAQAGMMLRIPVVHLHGGEITEGAYDDAIRHAISKLSYLHFTSTEQYKKRVIQLGENPDRVHNVGAIGLDHLRRSQLMTLKDLAGSLAFPLRAPYFLVTYHPVTLANEDPVSSFQAITDALDQFPDHQVILTYPNADDGGRKIIPLIESYASSRVGRVLAIKSLGQVRYLSAVKHADAVIGNSSSGIIEVPSFEVPTINIGERQNGRLAAKSVLNCNANKKSIVNSILVAIDLKLSGDKIVFSNPYGDGKTSKRIIEIIKKTEFKSVKTFFNVEVI